MTSAVIVAGGMSSRYGGKNKLDETFLGKSVLEHSVNAFYSLADEIIVVGYDCGIEGVKTVKGGATRFLSVKNGLDAVNSMCDTVLVHDGARPFVSRELISKLIREAEERGSAVPYVPVTDTVWEQGSTPRLLDRDRILAVQTPQCFRFAKLKDAFDRADGDCFTDESSLYFAAYGEVNFVEGERTNGKITYFGDVPSYRIGTGFDVHPFCEGQFVRLGGVNIPFTKSLKGHSDADALCHAICDAILSASSNKDIGHQFPDSDPKYAGADSLGLLRDCTEIARSCGFEVINVSAVVICEQPKLAPYIDRMAETLGKNMGISPSCVNLTATTTEKLGALGHGDGIACQAQALLRHSMT